jgi:hypothetical protein
MPEKKVLIFLEVCLQGTRLVRVRKIAVAHRARFDSLLALVGVREGRSGEKCRPIRVQRRDLAQNIG